jgi:preprotein translocase subunit SecG
VGFLKTLIQIIYILICAVLAFIVLKQEGKGNDLSGALTGATDSYWSKIRGRSKEGWLERATRILAASFIILSVVLNLKW